MRRMRRSKTKTSDPMMICMIYLLTDRPNVVCEAVSSLVPAMSDVSPGGDGCGVWLTCHSSDDQHWRLGVAELIVSLQLDLYESVGEGELDGVSGGDLGDHLLYHLSRPHPGGGVGEVVSDLPTQREKCLARQSPPPRQLTGKYFSRKWSMGTPLSSGSCQERSYGCEVSHFKMPASPMWPP